VGNNILIPLDLLVRTYELLDYFDISKYDRVVRDDYHAIKRELNRKLHKLELREAYSKILRAKDEDARHSARMEYLWQKNQIGDL